MGKTTNPCRGKNAGIISTRIAGMDGVSMETRKWGEILEKEGLNCFFLAGELDTPPDISFVVEKAHFTHPEIREIYNESFDLRTRKPSLTKKIQHVKDHLKKKVYDFIRNFNIDLFIVENALCIPLNIPLGIALTEIICETGMKTVAHHHDFFWERPRFLTNCVWDYLNMAFPPHLPFIQHVVINSSADNQLSLRTGISATIVPNVMDFENPPPPTDEYSKDVRESLGVGKDELFILQPTRVIKRKGIEHAIEMVSRLGMKAKLVVSHASGDEGWEYEQRVKEYSSLMGVKTLFESDIINEYRGRTKEGRKIYTLWDVYPHADLVTYPSDFEGFGNAFLETVYFRKPIVVNNYSIYKIDIKPKGFKVIELDGYVTRTAIEHTVEILKNPELREEMVNHNFEIGRSHYSYDILHKKIKGLIMNYFGT